MIFGSFFLAAQFGFLKILGETGEHRSTIILGKKLDFARIRFVPSFVKGSIHFQGSEFLLAPLSFFLQFFLNGKLSHLQRFHWSA